MVVVGSGAICVLMPNRKVFSQDADLRSRTFGRYENQLRMFGSPEKVFNYFASVSSNDSKEM